MPFQPAPQPCWLILAEEDWLGCGRAFDAAVWLAARVWGEEIAAGAQTEGPPVLRRADGLCVQVLCAGCGRWLADPETAAPLHGLSVPDVLALAAEHGWAGERCPSCRRASV